MTNSLYCRSQTQTQTWMAIILIILSRYATNQVRAKAIQSIRLGGWTKFTIAGTEIVVQYYTCLYKTADLEELPMRSRHLCESIAIAGLICIGLFFSGCRQKAAPPPAGPAEVAYVTVQTERVVLTTDLPGRTNAYLVAEIRPQVSGLLQKRLFEEGAFVKEGEILYQIDPAPYQAAYDQAKAALALSESEIALAEANLPALRSRAERLKGLVAIRAVGQQDYDDAAAALRQAEANLGVKRTAIEVNRATMHTASINLSYTPIKAPISGRVGRSGITVGAMVTAYQPTPLAVIQQLDPIYVDVTQANAVLLSLRRSLESGDLKRGGISRRKVKLLLEDGTPYSREGTLQFQDVTVDPTTGSVTLRLVFANPKNILLPGTFVRAVVEEGVNEQAILIPQQGVSRDPKGNPIALLVSNANKVEQRLLTLDRAIGDKWLVTKGLAPGDKVIVEGLQKVRAGDPIRPVAFESQPSAEIR
jgi:membrane fusion protein, multidrug efflux system